MGTKVGAEHPMYQTLTALLQRTPRSGWFMRGGVQYFRVNPDKSLSVKNGACADELSFSYSKCIKPPPSLEKQRADKLTQAMRAAIQPQIEAFREKHFVNGQTRCANLNCPSADKGLKRDEIHVDHAPPTFLELKNRFLEEVKSSDVPKGFTVDKDADSATYKRVVFRNNHLSFRDRWERYHKEYCVLQITCRACNLGVLKRKGGRETAVSDTTSYSSTTAPRYIQTTIQHAQTARVLSVAGL